MTAQQRRQQIIAILTKATGPVSASALAGILSLLTSVAGLPEIKETETKTDEKQ